MKKKILLFPLLDSLPSGHHQVAGAIMEYVKSRSSEMECKKIDLLNRWNPMLENVMTKSYLWWIQQFPKSYAWVYRKLAYQSERQRSYKYYELLFQKEMEKIIASEKPDLIICTHAFPSYLVNNLKKSGACAIPLLNIYTDFFMNDVWGKEMVDSHFVSDQRMKSDLMSQHQIPGHKIFLTGIPIDESFSQTTHNEKTDCQFNIIISGGSAGLSNLTKLLQRSKNEKRVNFSVLCGNNKALFNEISNLNRSIFTLYHIFLPVKK